ncbi:MAG: hypothetical protein QM703_22825 [Gemmatales bacterium]
MAISKEPDLNQEVYCPVCQWYGTLKETILKRGELARCPKCKPRAVYSVEKSQIFPTAHLQEDFLEFWNKREQTGETVFLQEGMTYRSADFNELFNTHEIKKDSDLIRVWTAEDEFIELTGAELKEILKELEEQNWGALEYWRKKNEVQQIPASDC